jgi:hypothetical protein
MLQSSIIKSKIRAVVDDDSAGVWQTITLDIEMPRVDGLLIAPGNFRMLLKRSGAAKNRI